MYAVIKTGGKQYRVEKGQVLKIELITNNPGDTHEFKEVLMIADGEKVTCGAPVLKGAVVKAEVLTHGRHKKIEIIKFRRRKHHDKQMGHRQYYTQVRISDITA
jgi:large subunit ribosomal protein L21